MSSPHFIMTILVTITPVDSDVSAWTLRHCRSWERPFITLEGCPHIWNWDECGKLMKDGEPLTGYTITIEKEQEN